MTATEELRRLLDERVVEWDELVGHPVVVGTAWYDRDGCSCTALEHADDVPDGMLSVQANLTPEQAIAATLGDGTLQAENDELREEIEVVGTVAYVHGVKRLQDENDKLRELVDYMTPIAWYGASERERDRMRELGVEE